MNLKLFLDIDGVFSDFNKAVEKLGSVPAKGLAEDATEDEKQAMYDAIEKAGITFWSDMELKSEAEDLWEILKSYKPVFLSSPGKFSFAPAGKIEWVKKNFPGISLFIEEDKYIYAEPNTILIDDMAKNINAWKAAGGLGILYKNDPQIIKQELIAIIKEKQMTKLSFLIKLFVAKLKKDFSIGWTDETSPHGIGYRIMTPDGMKTFDKNEKLDFENEKRNVEKWLKTHEHFGQHIPEKWKKELKEKRIDDTLPAKALEQKSEHIRQHIVDKDIENPFLFARNLNKITNYVTDMRDPTKHGFIMDLSKYSNEIGPRIRKMSKGDTLPLSKETQLDLLEKAEKLRDDGTLLKHIEDLFTEKEILLIKRSLANVIKAFSKYLLRISAICENMVVY